MATVGRIERDGRRADVVAEFIRRSFFPPFSYSTLSRTMNHNHNHPPTTRLLLLHTEYYLLPNLYIAVRQTKSLWSIRIPPLLSLRGGYQYHYHRPRRIIATTFHFGRDKKYLLTHSILTIIICCVNRSTYLETEAVSDSLFCSSCCPNAQVPIPKYYFKPVV